MHEAVERKILNSFSCVLCNEEAETCDHLFLECFFAQAVWLQSPPLSDYKIHSNIKFIDAMNVALKSLFASVFDRLCIVCWMIWKCRNKVAFNNIAPSHKGLWSWVDLYKMEFQKCSRKNTQESSLTVVKWNPS